MTEARSPRPAGRSGKPATTGIKTLITTMALAGILGGWALLSRQETPSQAAAAAQAPIAQTQELSPLPPIPTVVAVPTLEPLPAQLAAGGGNQPPLDGSVPAQLPAVAQPPVAAAAPKPAPALRSISAPAPRPVTVTRSSR